MTTRSLSVGLSEFGRPRVARSDAPDPSRQFSASPDPLLCGSLHPTPSCAVRFARPLLVLFRLARPLGLRSAVMELLESDHGSPEVVCGVKIDAN